MSMFSSGLRVTGLDDFLKPEQECTVLKNDHKSDQPKIAPQIKLRNDGSFVESKNGKDEELQPTKITLADCLACSGCLTTSETMLVEAQGLGQFEKHLVTSEVIVVSLSSQSRASLAAHYNLTQEQVFAKLITFFSKIGVKHVLDANLGLELSLLECGKEFIKKKKEQMNGDKKALPLLLGVCPGWVCYCEKKHGEYLPYMSTTKSPQQIMGSLVKSSMFADYIGANNPKQIYHVSIMSCYDKKLEASRDDFHNKEDDLHEVDCVLTSKEIQQLIEQHDDIDFVSLPESPFNNTKWVNVERENMLNNFVGGTSGGYLEYVFVHAAKELYDIDITEVEYKQTSNRDLIEVVLEREGKTLLKFARSNGFRNIQNIVRKLKTKKCDYDFVEMMACPGGCTNGGGQISFIDGGGSIGASDDKKENKKQLQKVNEIYNQPKNQKPGESTNVNTIYEEMLMDDKKRETFLHTKYHAIPSDNQNKSALSITW
eukprot:TRINITY_DN956_c0_g1_i1.p2 TRINITY_DN956_c0_g1~~TRINITY_DN956_c0_g1_i1.p2  ORF type:complete len:485 (-),score=105.53 TRINITY_DN956_c0_g1_i1:3173-4627(-)